MRTDDGLLVVAAGVLYYLEEPQVRELLSRLATAAPGSEVVFDVCSPRGTRIANRKVIQDGGMDSSAVLRWGLERPREIAGWDARIEVLDSHQLFRGITGRLPLRARFGTLLSDAMNIMAMVHCASAHVREGVKEDDEQDQRDLAQGQPDARSRDP